MTTSKTIKGLVAAAATALLVTGCATTSDTEPPEVSAPTTSETQSGPVELGLGETANLVLGANGPRDIGVTVTNITVSDQCRHGINDYGGEPGWSGQTDGYFIEVSGEIDVRESPDSFSVPQWMAADAERNIIEVFPAYECADAEVAGVQTFNHGVLPGTKAQAMEEYWVDTLPAEWFLNQPYEDHAFSWPVPEREVAEPTTEPAPGAAPAPAYTAPATAPTPIAPAPVAPVTPAPPPPVIGMTGAPGHDAPGPLDKTISHCGDPSLHQTGTTFFTDGTTGWTETCSAQMMQAQGG